MNQLGGLNMATQFTQAMTDGRDVEWRVNMNKHGYEKQGSYTREDHLIHKTSNQHCIC